MLTRCDPFLAEYSSVCDAATAWLTFRKAIETRLRDTTTNNTVTGDVAVQSSLH
jgi:hypothetical protein